jgi:hypothetical protein
MVVNLHYVRAAIEANTGQRLRFSEIRRLLVDEGLLTARQAQEEARAFEGYGSLYSTESFDRREEPRIDTTEGLPDDWYDDDR